MFVHLLLDGLLLDPSHAVLVEADPLAAALLDVRHQGSSAQELGLASDTLDILLLAVELSSSQSEWLSLSLSLSPSTAWSGVVCTAYLLDVHVSAAFTAEVVEADGTDDVPRALHLMEEQVLLELEVLVASLAVFMVRSELLVVDELSGRCKRLVAALVGARKGSRAAGRLLVLHLCRLAAVGTVSSEQ